MSDLIAIAYPDEGSAAQVRDVLARLHRAGSIELDDAVAVVKARDGRVSLDQSASGVVEGALWGTLIGLVFFAPLLGLLGVAVSAASGTITGLFSDYGIEDQFMRDLGAQLQPGTSALFLLVRKAAPDKVLDAVRQYGGTVLRTSLTKEAEARLQQALQPRPAA